MRIRARLSTALRMLAIAALAMVSFNFVAKRFMAENKQNMAGRGSIVVIGGGLAGMSAALEALHQARNTVVTLLEKEARLGGNSAKASSGINGAETRTQAAQGIEDSIKTFAQDTTASGRGRSSKILVDKLTQDSAQAVAWLQDLGVDLRILARLGGHSVARTHRLPEINGRAQPVGWSIVSTLSKHLDKMWSGGSGRLRIVTNAQATALLADAADKGVSGVEFLANGKVERVQANALVLATGGFAGAHAGFLDKYAPQVAALATTNGPFATGDGLQLGTALGADLVDMDQVQVHPTGFVRPSDVDNPTKFLAAEALRGAGGVLLNARGMRFVDELDTRDRVTAAITSNCSAPDTRAHHSSTGTQEGPDAAAFLVLTQEAADRFGHGALAFYERMGLISQAAGMEELAKALRVNEATLRQSVSEASMYFWGVVTPVTHYCMGGLRFDVKARVLQASGQPIRGLFAAGEVTGGLHGANRLAGNSLLECVVFGREAGRQASAFASLVEGSNL
ncbi:hypothetical protein LPJ79_002830 [Coemansia sp. RSA 1821]|nr:hypothetical protein LPJ68_003978 [Coemansia sp. RSA 1086]KAJ1750489.1 hypothetical protein LPJ79_002830 [Coemansia sp. RSA 1821]KAJ2674549.1 hypothetical protein IWW42_001720 [Coemansia sp. RSA 1085]